MNDERKDKGKNVGGSASLIGPIWFIGWLFTIGFSNLTFWKAVLALVIWPFYLGNSVGM